MKLQFGLLHTDGKPARPEELAALLNEIEARPTEMSGQIAAGSLLIAFRGDRITHEEDSETQPWNDGSHIITWDGRLDNREELARRLGLIHLQNIPDPLIVLKAYETFGQSVFKDLIGEFALTLWCKRTKALLFARSACGARPLFYTLTKDTLFWSSDFAHLVRVSNVDLDVNENYFLEYLLTQPSTRHTPLTKLNSVPANCLLRFENGLLKQVDVLWNPANIKGSGCRNDEEYEEHFRGTLTDAVRVRLRAKSPVFAELSGGLDSSAIVLTADQILKANHQSLEDLRTLSGVYEQSKTSDEGKFIRLVEEQRGSVTLRVREEAQGFTLGLQNPEFSGLPNPNHCSPGRYETFAAIMRVGGGQVLLTGLGGDHLFWSAPEGAPLVADELRRGNLFGAHRQCCTWSRAAAAPYLQLMFNKAVPLAIGGRYDLLEIPDWVSPAMRSQIVKHKANFNDQPKHVSPSRRAQLFSVDLLFRTIGCGYFNEYKDLYVSHPYTHRPLVEFCLAASLSKFLRAGQTRSLMRRALVGLLPKKICQRVSKSGADEAYIRALQREWASNSDIKRWCVCERGFIDPGQLAVSLDGMRLGIQRMSGHLMRLVSMERWLRSLGSIRACSTAPPREPAQPDVSSLLPFEAGLRGGSHHASAI